MYALLTILKPIYQIGSSEFAVISNKKQLELPEMPK